MTVEETFFSTLTADGDVAPLIVSATSPVTHRLFAQIAPDNVAKPYIVYQIINAATPVYLTDMANIEDVRFQADVYSTTYSAGRALTDHIKDALNTNMNLSEFQFLSLYEVETKLHRFFIDFSVWE